MTDEVKKVLLENVLPQMTCELLLHLNFFNQVIEDGKQSSGIVEKAKGLLASNHMALIMIREVAGQLHVYGTPSKRLRWVAKISYHAHRHRFRSTNYNNVRRWLDDMTNKFN